MRASRGDRERAIDMLKAAFVQDRLTKDELDARVGQALAARTYADLDSVTADIPISPKLPPLPQATPAPLNVHSPGRREVSRAVKSGAGALAVVITVTSTAAGVAAGNLFLGVALAVAALTLAAIVAGFAALVIRVALYFEEQSRRRKHHRGRTPPRPGPGTRDPARWRPPSAPPHRPGGDTALASILWTVTRRPRRSTTASTSLRACRSPATRRRATR